MISFLKSNIKKIVLLVGILFLSLLVTFEINSYYYFVMGFLIIGLLAGITFKYSSVYILILWLLSVVLVPEMKLSNIYISIVIGLFGCLIGRIMLKMKEIKQNNIVISDNIKKISFIFPIFIIMAFELFNIIANIKVYYSFSFLSILMTVFIIYLIWFILLAITNTTFKSNLLLSILLLIFFIANQMKIYFTNEPISVTDLVMIKETGELMVIIRGSVFSSIWNYRKEIIILLLNLFVILNISKKFSYKNKNVKFRIFSLLPCIVLMYVLLIPSEKVNISINKYVYNDPDINSLSLLSENYGAYRVIAGLYKDYLSTIDYTKQILNDDDLKEIYKTVKEEKTSDFKKPNIIVMFTESFWDITSQNSINFDVDPLKEYHEIREKGIKIDTISPVFGGKSANTEFEFLTGGTLNHFTSGTIAYNKYYKSDDSKNNPNIINELKKNGYTAEIMNALTAEIFRCDEVYKYIYIDKVTHLTNELNRTPNDKELIDRLIDRFNNKKKDEKLFYMSISMESHMPYKYSNYKKYDFNITGNINNKTKNVISAYTQAIRNASLQLKRVYDYIQTLDEDTIIIFYGDHLPYLRSNFVNIYDLINEFNTDDKLFNTYKKYNTETLILSNYDIKYNDLTSMSPDLIFTTIVNNMDIELSDYYKWLYSTRHILPASNNLITKDTTGILYSTSNLPIEMKSTFDTRKKIQNYLFH